MSVTLAQASNIVDATLKKARDLKQMPQTVVVLDAGGHLVCAKREDGSGIIRFEVAVGKAYGALGMGWGSRTMMERAAQNPNFLTAIVSASACVDCACASRKTSHPARIASATGPVCGRKE